MPQRRAGYRVVSVFYSFTLSAGIGNRAPQLSVLDGANGQLLVLFGTSQPALGTGQVTFACNLNVGRNADLGVETVALPDDLWIQPQWSLTIGIGSALAGDTIANITVLSEWYEGKELAKPPTEPQDS